MLMNEVLRKEDRKMKDLRRDKKDFFETIEERRRTTRSNQVEELF